MMIITMPLLGNFHSDNNNKINLFLLICDNTQIFLPSSLNELKIIENCVKHGERERREGGKLMWVVGLIYGMRKI